MYHFRKYGVFALFGVIIVIGIVLLNRENDVSFNQNHETEAEEDDTLLSGDNTDHDGDDAGDELGEDIAVDIKGAVTDPGVYTVETSARIHDVIELAGGFLKDADEQQINLAERVQDEMYVYVPKQGEEEPPEIANTAVESGNGDSEMVRVNQATSTELESLDGIGPGKAQDILDYIEENGPLSSEDDLLEVSGIGEKTLENLKEQVIIP